jgi:ATP-dependent RNA helicase RhlE
MSFDSLGLSKPILQALSDHGYDSPTPIQAQAIPAVLAGQDVMAAAQTGTGKTAGFTLPILEKLSTGEKAKPNRARVLVLTPTRELAAQVNESIQTYGKHLDLNSTVVFGGVKINPQMTQLRRGVDILVATPGRLLDLHNQKAIKFDDIEVLVLDEADRMLDMGFIHDIRKIIALLPAQRQNLMFSATFSDEIRTLAKTIVNDPIEISVTPRNSTVDTVKQSLVPVDKKNKTALLIHMIKEHGWNQVLVFSRTKHGANKLATQLGKHNIGAVAIHGNKSQGARTRALASFKAGSVHVLVATDIAARGIDIDQLPYVVNFDLPNVPEDYVHRIGRTGRAGSTGEAISLVSADEHKQLCDIENLIQKHVPREYEPGFEPDHELPNSRPIRDSKPKRAKKPKSQPTGQSSGNSSSRNSSQRSGNRSGDRSDSGNSCSNGNQRRHSPNRSGNRSSSGNSGNS